MRTFSAILAAALVAAVTFAAQAGETGVVVGPEAKGIIDVVLQHGVVGAMLLIVLYGYWRKDNQLAAERVEKDKQLEAKDKKLADERAEKDKQIAAESAARVADAKANGEVLRSLVVTTTTQMERFNDTAEALVNELRTERHAAAHPPARRS